MRIEIDGTLSIRESAMFVGMATVRAIAMFDGTLTGRGMGMSDEIGPPPSAAQTYGMVTADEAFDLHADGNQLTVIEQLEAID